MARKKKSDKKKVVLLVIVALLLVVAYFGGFFQSKYKLETKYPGVTNWFVQKKKMNVPWQKQADYVRKNASPSEPVYKFLQSLNWSGWRTFLYSLKY